MSTPPAARDRLEHVLGRLRGRRIHVIGPSGTEGSAVIAFLLDAGITSITAHDLATPDTFAATVRRTHQWLAPAERETVAARLAGAIDLRYRDRYLEGVEKAEWIVVPQSWFRHAENDPLRRLRADGIPFTSMTQLFFETAPCPIIGVTGTNGKFTVATLIFRMLRAGGITSYVSGNDRSHVPMLTFLDRLTPDAWLVLEISNRQLIDLPYSPQVGVVTNLAPHHLDDHGSLEGYAAVKANLIRHQGEGDDAVLNLDDAHTRAMAPVTAGRVSWFSVEDPVERGAWIHRGAIWVRDDDGTQEVVPTTALPLPGQAMVENALASTAAAACVGVPAPVMDGVLRRFEGLPYRFSRVGTFGGVVFYEDSLATNPTAAAAAIRSLDRPFLLIAGGMRRGATPADFEPMVAALAATGLCRVVLLIGMAAGALRDALAALDDPQRPTVITAGTLEAAMAEARRLASEADAVLLSPGCESFDQFADYRERGDRFRALAEGFARSNAEDTAGNN